MLHVIQKKVKRQLREKGFKELVLGSATTFIMRILGMVAGMIFTFLMAKQFGASTVGAFHISQTVLLLFTILTRLGMDTAIVKLFAENLAFKRWTRMRGIYNTVLSSIWPLGLFWSVVLYFSAHLIANEVFHKPHYEPYLKLISIAILPMALRFVNSECYRGMRMLRLYAYSHNVGYFVYAIVVMMLLKWVLAYTNLLSGFGNIAAFIPNISFVLALMILAVTSTISVKNKLGTHTKEVEHFYSAGQILAISAPMMLSNSMMQISGWINTLVLGHYSTDADVGIYRVVLNVSSVCAFILMSINSVAAPRFAELYARKDLYGLAFAARQTSAVNFYASIPIFVLIIIFREQIMGYFGNEFLAGAAVLLFTMAGQFMNIFCGSVGSFLNMTGRQKEFQNILLICTLINLVSCFIFIPKYGLMGSALCTMLFMSSWNIISAVFIYRKYKIQTFYWPLSKMPKFEHIQTSTDVLAEHSSEGHELATPSAQTPKVDVAIVGIQKAATSSLKNYLAEHPDIITHARLEFTFFVNDNEYLQGYNRWFNNDFDTHLDFAGKKILVKNVGIVFWEEGLQRLKQHNPDSKIILLLRNPVDRAYSAYWYAINKGIEKHKTFEEALKASPNDYKRKWEKSIVSYYAQGHYYELIQRLYYYFPKENVQIILQEDLASSGEIIIHDLYKFIGVDANFTPDLSKKYNESAGSKFRLLNKLFSNDNNPLKKIFNAVLPNRQRGWIKRALRKINSARFKQPPIDMSTRKHLVEYFKPHNKKLGELLGRDLTHWDK